MGVSVCEECGFEICGAVEAVLHYQKTGKGPGGLSPCEQRQNLTRWKAATPSVNRPDQS